MINIKRVINRFSIRYEVYEDTEFWFVVDTMDILEAKYVAQYFKNLKLKDTKKVLRKKYYKEFPNMKKHVKEAINQIFKHYE